MISICIPTYNYDVTKLVTELAEQCEAENIIYEILIIEDGSDDSYVEQNSAISKFEKASHIHQKENKGRSATRNKLADMAQYDNILFIDCDSMPAKKDFIKNYINNISKQIVCGGTTYTESQKVKKHELRYKFGINREAIKSVHRNKNPNDSFATNNFLISKNIINQVKFRESIKAYGHEDTILGFDLDNESYEIKHIDNPVVHLGIETNKVFLKKTETSISNLVKIESEQIIDKKYLNRIKLIKTYNRLKRLRLKKVFFSFTELFIKKMKNHLIKSKNPYLIIFDFYKLNYYCKMKSNNTHS